MKNRVLKLATGLLTVGVFGVTGLVGAQSLGIANVETTAHVMSENQDSMPSSASDSGRYKEVTQYNTIPEFEKSLKSGTWVAHTYLKGYKGDVFLVAEASYDYDGKQYAEDARIYTEVDGKVRCIGCLNAMGGLLIKRTDNGILFANGKMSYESYLVSADGKEIVHKDYYDGYDWGYTNETNDPGKKVEFYKNNSKVNEILALNKKAKNIEFYRVK